MTTAVVTGGAGFLGSHLCEYLLEEGHRVVCIDNLETASLENVEHLRDESFHSQTRSFCYVDDLIRGLYLLASSGEHMPINLGNPSEFTILELAETVIRVTESGSEIVHEALPVDDPQIRQPDITLAREILGWQPEIELEEGLRRMLPSLGREPVSV